MNAPSRFAASLLEASASAYAGLAAGRLLEQGADDDSERPTAGGFRWWQAQLSERLRELEAALRAGEPQLFARQLSWSREAWRARKLPEIGLRASLEALREVLQEELPATASAELEPFLDAAHDVLVGPPQEGEPGLVPQREADRLALEYLHAALEGENHRALELVALAAKDMGVDVAYLDVVIAAQREVGRLWHAGQLSVAEEHAVTATTRRALAVLYHRAEVAPAKGFTVLAAAVEGNVHDLAIQVVADFFSLAGWRSYCLGGDMPAEELAAAAEGFHADLLVLSASLSVQLSSLENTVLALRRRSQDRIKVMVGGRAFLGLPDLWKRLGADGYAADARAAVQEAETLLGHPGN